MNNAEEKLNDILRSVFMLPQVKDAYYSIIVDNAVPLMIEEFKETGDSAEELLQTFYDMEDPSELQELVNYLTDFGDELKLSEEALNDMREIIRRESEES